MLGHVMGSVEKQKESAMQSFGSAERNKEPILKTIQKHLPNSASEVLEVASGTGQHVAYFAQALPNVTFQPTDIDATMFESIQAWSQHLQAASNVRTPFILNVLNEPNECKELAKGAYSAIIVTNMLHISSFATTPGLMKLAHYALKNAGLLIIYGPFSLHGKLEPESNAEFDRALKARNAEWGIRDVDDVSKAASTHGLSLVAIEAMPSNNTMLIYRYSAESEPASEKLESGEAAKTEQ